MYILFTHILSIYSQTRLTHIHQMYDQQTKPPPPPQPPPDDIDGHSSGSSTSIQGKSYVYIRLNIHFILVFLIFLGLFCVFCCRLKTQTAHT